MQKVSFLIEGGEVEWAEVGFYERAILEVPAWSWEWRTS
jgi:hypothetical protein